MTTDTLTRDADGHVALTPEQASAVARAVARPLISGAEDGLDVFREVIRRWATDLSTVTADDIEASVADWGAVALSVWADALARYVLAVAPIVQAAAVYRDAVEARRRLDTGMSPSGLATYRAGLPAAIAAEADAKLELLIAASEYAAFNETVASGGEQ